MPDEGEVLATRVAWLELAEERRLVREGYELLDEKRMLLAAEIMRQLAAHAALSARITEASAAARAAAAAAFAACGCDGLAAEPPRRLDGAPLTIETRPYLGITLATATVDAGDAPPAHAPLLPVPEVRACAAAHLAILRTAAETAACAGISAGSRPSTPARSAGRGPSRTLCCRRSTPR